jgi:hypothetical protein
MDFLEQSTMFLDLTNEYAHIAWGFSDATTSFGDRKERDSIRHKMFEHHVLKNVHCWFRFTKMSVLSLVKDNGGLRNRGCF